MTHHPSSVIKNDRIYIYDTRHERSTHRQRGVTVPRVLIITQPRSFSSLRSRRELNFHVQSRTNPTQVHVPRLTVPMLAKTTLAPRGLPFYPVKQTSKQEDRQNRQTGRQAGSQKSKTDRHTCVDDKPKNQKRGRERSLQPCRVHLHQPYVLKRTHDNPSKSPSFVCEP